LREAMRESVPVLYFLGVAPQRYTLIWPTYVVGWSAAELKAQLAFGAPLAGTTAWTVDPDYRIHISEAFLSMRDGPLFEQGIRAIDGQSIRRPKRPQDYPDRDRLAERFERFLAAR
jgi:hypothetical protein